MVSQTGQAPTTLEINISLPFKQDKKITAYETNSATHDIKDHVGFGLIHYRLPALADVCYGHALGYLPLWVSTSIFSRLGAM